MSWFFMAFKKAGTFKTRSRRAEYLWFTAWMMLIAIVLTAFDMALGTFQTDKGMGVLSGIFVLLCLIPGLTLQIRRLHDIGRSGWWTLIGLTGVGTFVLMVASLWKSQAGANQWGPNPTLDENGNKLDERAPDTRSKTQKLVPILLVLVCTIGSLYLLGRNKMDQEMAEVLAQRGTVQSAGASTGRNTDERGCFVNAVERYKALQSHSISAQALTAIETKSCLHASQPTKDFCKTVPAPTAIMEMVQWNIQTCTSLGLGQDHDCLNMVKPIAEYCASPVRAKKGDI